MNLNFLEETGTYVMKNHLLLVPAEWMLNPEFSKDIEATKPILKKFVDDKEFRNIARPKDFPILNHVTTHLSDVFSVPLFSDTFCQVMVDEINNIKATNGFKVNEEEVKEVQIEEFVLLESAPGWYRSMFQLIYAKINPIFDSIFSRKVNSGNIQLANYNPKEITQTSWHHDGNADITMVVPLNTGEYEGGGTEFWRKGEVDPLPNGHALIFPTFNNLHRGLPLKSGDRYLFVFWLKFMPPRDNNKESETETTDDPDIS
jgi:hypothetical protein